MHLLKGIHITICPFLWTCGILNSFNHHNYFNPGMTVFCYAMFPYTMALSLKHFNFKGGIHIWCRMLFTYMGAFTDYVHKGDKWSKILQPLATIAQQKLNRYKTFWMWFVNAPSVKTDNFMEQTFSTIYQIQLEPPNCPKIWHHMWMPLNTKFQKSINENQSCNIF